MASDQHGKLEPLDTRRLKGAPQPVTLSTLGSTVGVDQWTMHLGVVDWSPAVPYVRAGGQCFAPLQPDNCLHAREHFAQCLAKVVVAIRAKETIAPRVEPKRSDAPRFAAAIALRRAVPSRVS